MMSERPAFIITVDTEGDNEWSRPNPILTRNAAYLPRFQALCEEFGFKPTWLTNYEMATSPEFVRFGRDVIARGAGEIGMHLHAWSSPPIKPLTHDDHATHPYLIEFAPDVMADEGGLHDRSAATAVWREDGQSSRGPVGVQRHLRAAVGRTRLPCRLLGDASCVLAQDHGQSGGPRGVRLHRLSRRIRISWISIASIDPANRRCWKCRRRSSSRSSRTHCRGSTRSKAFAASHGSTSRLHLGSFRTDRI